MSQLKDYYLKREQFKKILGGKCKVCMSTEKLEFDHINPKLKKFTVTSGWSFKEKVLKKELEKCQLLCHSCHQKKTNTERRARMWHGSLGMYRWGKCRCALCIQVSYAARKRRRKELAGSSTVKRLPLEQ